MNSTTMQTIWQSIGSRAGKDRVALCLLGAAVAIGLAGCGHGEEQSLALPERPPAPVSVVSAVAQDVPIYLDEIGRAQAVEVVTIVPQVGGKVIAAHVQDGAFVKKGDLLFEIDPRPIQAELASAAANLAQRKAEKALAQTEFNRVKDMLASNAISQLEYDQKKSALEVAEALIQAAQAAVETAQLNLEYTKIHSPIDGRAGARLVDVGNVVKPNEGSMLVLQRLDPIYAEFTITENDLGTVRKFIAERGMTWGDDPTEGLKVLVDIPADSARVLSALGAPAPATQPAQNTAGPREGQLSFLDNSVQSGTGTVKLRATLPNADRYFWPGQFVNVRLVLATNKDAVLIPAQAQQVGQTGAYVYVVKQGEVTDPVTHETRPATIAELRPIVAGQRHGDSVVVEQGVAAGEQVVTVGHMMIQPGGPVAVTQPEGQQSQAAAH